MACAKSGIIVGYKSSLPLCLGHAGHRGQDQLVAHHGAPAAATQWRAGEECAGGTTGGGGETGQATGVL